MFFIYILLIILIWNFGIYIVFFAEDMPIWVDLITGFLMVWIVYMFVRHIRKDKEKVKDDIAELGFASNRASDQISMQMSCMTCGKFDCDD